MTKINIQKYEQLWALRSYTLLFILLFALAILIHRARAKPALKTKIAIDCKVEDKTSHHMYCDIQHKASVTRCNFSSNLSRNGIAVQVARKIAPCNTPAFKNNFSSNLCRNAITRQVALEISACNTSFTFASCV